MSGIESFFDDHLRIIDFNETIAKTVGQLVDDPNLLVLDPEVGSYPRRFATLCYRLLDSYYTAMGELIARGPCQWGVQGVDGWMPCDLTERHLHSLYEEDGRPFGWPMHLHEYRGMSPFELPGESDPVEAAEKIVMWSNFTQPAWTMMGEFVVRNDELQFLNPAQQRADYEASEACAKALK